MKRWGTRLVIDQPLQTGRGTARRPGPIAGSLIAGVILVLLLAACSGATSTTSAGQGPEPAADTAIPAPTGTAVTVEEPAAAPVEMAPEATSAPAAGMDADESRDSVAVMVRTLGNLSYEGVAPTGAISLTDGLATYDDGSSIEPSIRLVAESVALGDLDGDGAVDGAAVLEDDSSGSGRFMYLVAVLSALTNPKPTSPLLLGDRVQIKSLVIDGAGVVVEMVTQGPDDPLCCGTLNVRQVFGLEDGQLVQQSSEEMGQTAPADSSGG